MKKIAITLAVLPAILFTMSCQKEDYSESQDSPADALPGVFSVSATKKVHFSKGNLWADGDKALHFEANQYAFSSSYESSHVSRFTWSSTIADAVSESHNGDHLFCNESNKQSVDGSDPIYYALSTEEWQYLFNYGDYTSEIRE